MSVSELTSVCVSCWLAMSHEVIIPPKIEDVTHCIRITAFVG